MSQKLATTTSNFSFLPGRPGRPRHQPQSPSSLCLFLVLGGLRCPQAGALGDHHWWRQRESLPPSGEKGSAVVEEGARVHRGQLVPVNHLPDVLGGWAQRC